MLITCIYPTDELRFFYEWQDRSTLAIFYACLILAFRSLKKMVSFAPFSFPCAQRYHSLTSLGLMSGLVLALMLHCAFFARFAPRKIAVGGNGKVSCSQGCSYYCFLRSSSGGTENKHKAHGNVHSRVQVGWTEYFIFRERLKFPVCMKTECWSFSLASGVIISTFHRSLRAPTMWNKINVIFTSLSFPGFLYTLLFPSDHT